jgi:hypothetical protein
MLKGQMQVHRLGAKAAIAAKSPARQNANKRQKYAVWRTNDAS